MTPSIYDYIKQEESRFQTDEIHVGDNWTWNFRNHVQLIFHLKNSQFYTGDNNWLRTFKNIMEPILNLADWMEDIELKDIVFFIESQKGRVLSFLLKKYHDEIYSHENDIDTLIDEITESDNAYGGVLLQKTGTGRPEVIKLTTIAFCDQSDMLGGPMAFKHYFSPEKLRTMKEYGWGEEKYGADTSIDDLIVLATNEREPAGTFGKKDHTPGKTIEVYIVRGDMPEHYLKDNDNFDDYYCQLQIRAFYTKKDGTKEGVCLYRMKDTEGYFMFHTARPVDGRGLGRGIGEMMLHPQIWTNFLSIHKHNFLEAASKVPLYTDDPNYQNRNRIQDMENLEITTVEDGKRIYQVPTAAPANVAMITNGINEWYEFAQLSGSAFDPVLGKEQAAGTTFRGQERVIFQGRGFHDRRRGLRAKFIEQVYRDWIIPDMVNDIVDGKKFMASLTAEELGWVSDQLADNYAFEKQKEMILNGQIPPEKEPIKEFFLENFKKLGNRHLLEIVRDEFRDIEIRIGVNVAGKQKDLAGMSDKLLSILQYILANPQAFQAAMQIPSLAKAFNDIIEYSGLNQADFTAFAQNLPAPIPSPMQANDIAQASETPA